MTERHSHPAEGDRAAEPLGDHLRDVETRVRDIVPPPVSTPSGRPMVEFVSRLALVHDFGKLTTWFQAHIEDGNDPAGHPTHHAPLGALVAYYVLDCRAYDEAERLAGYLAVAVHHGTLPDVPKYVFDRTAWSNKSPTRNELQEEIIEQVADIDREAPSLAERFVDDATDGTGSWSELAERIETKALFGNIKTHVSRHGITHDSSGITSEFYPCVLQAWSALVLADKTSAANAPTSGFESSDPPEEVLSTYIDSLPREPGSLSDRERTLNEWRDDARRSVLENAREMVDRGVDVATITLPTGMGKTFTGLEAAMAIREHTDGNRIVYALPFTSIIDQVVDEIRGVFESDGRDDLLTVHHHLAETIVEIDDEEETDARARVEEMLGESWRSGLVVTTYVQLFESLAGPGNMQSMKLPALYDSVVILDEPQSLPHDWWLLIRRLVEVLTEEYGATVVAMTATQPELFEEDSMELVDDPRRYFEGIERVEYVLDDSLDTFKEDSGTPIPYADAAERIMDYSSEGDDILAVCNTIDSAAELTETLGERSDVVSVGEVYETLLRTRSPDDVDASDLVEEITARNPEISLVHLSTRIRPVDRLVLLETVKTLTNRPEPLVVVSTQLIEAGVDVSFDRVYRDFAPIDSIVQAAGRCNRSFENDRGTVTLWWLDAPEDKESTPSQAVYDMWGDSLLSLTVQVLSDQEVGGGPVPEPTVAWTCVQDYYRRLVEEKKVGKQAYVEFVDEGAFDELGSLSLIEQRRAVEVIVCRTEGDRNLIDEIIAAWNGYQFDRVRSLLDETRELQVSIPVYTTDSGEFDALKDLNTVHDETELRWVDVRSGSPFFDSTVGLVVPDSTVERRFL